MSLDNTIQPKHTTKDESQTASVAASGSGNGGSVSRKSSAQKPPEQTLKCPRCESPNTKFCYYNNYSLTQPRHFCKTCRRYWTKGGALRNIPIGGGCRKKKTRSSSSRFMNGDSPSKDSSFDIGGMDLFSGLSPPAMDFQLGGLKQNPPPFMNLRSLGISFPLMKQDHHIHQLHGGGLPSFQETGITDDLASSIESLSSINQDLHWKLQQQRLAMLMNDGGGEIEQNNQVVNKSPAQKLHPILFQNLEIPKPSMELRNISGDGLETEWFFDVSFAPVNVEPTTAIAPTQSNIAENYENGSINSWNNGIQEWDQFNQYSALP